MVVPTTHVRTLQPSLQGTAGTFQGTLLDVASLVYLAGLKRGGLSALGIQFPELSQQPCLGTLLFVPSFLEPSLLSFGWKSKAPYANPAMPVNHFQLASSE